MTTTWSILTPPAASGAIAIIELRATAAAELDSTLLHLNLGTLKTGLLSVRDLLGVDTGVVARWSDTCIHLMPHGGTGVVRGLTRRLLESGVLQAPESSPSYLEASSDLEARMLAALARAASPLAIDLLLDQPRRWAKRTDSDPVLDRALNKLIDPPLVVAIGEPNIGKSTLVNALAGRSVSIVADEPGTTRDHVGVMLDLGGLVVRYVDTPGMRPTHDVVERESQAIARDAAAGADLILLMGDSTTAPPAWNSGAELRIALRRDLGNASWAHEIAVSAATGEGVADLALMIREALVPQSALDDPRPWNFWA